MDILVVPDSHAEPGVSNERYDILNKYIHDTRPDCVVNIGDHADLPSLCSYDKGKKSFEGRRYRKDVDAAREASERLVRGLGTRGYAPRLVLTLGNHENRINKAVEDDAVLDGTISTKDLGYEETGWEVYPYLEPVTIKGVAFCHYFPSGVMNRPIGGENAANALIKKNHVSCVQGHSHLRDFSERTRPDGSRVLGLVVGCYFEHHHSFAGATNRMYWRGVVRLRGVDKGSYDHEWISIKRLRAAYGRSK